MHQRGVIFKDAEAAFRGFANELGRVTSYRALALTQSQFEFIQHNNSIWSSGRLKADVQTVEKVIKEHGYKKVFYARLYIGLGLLKYDPSLSLHDDPETGKYIPKCEIYFLDSCVYCKWIQRTRKEGILS